MLSADALISPSRDRPLPRRYFWAFTVFLATSRCVHIAGLASENTIGQGIGSVVLPGCTGDCNTIAFNQLGGIFVQSGTENTVEATLASLRACSACDGRRIRGV